MLLSLVYKVGVVLVFIKEWVFIIIYFGIILGVVGIFLIFIEISDWDKFVYWLCIDVWCLLMLCDGWCEIIIGIFESELFCFFLIYLLVL